MRTRQSYPRTQVRTPDVIRAEIAQLDFEKKALEYCLQLVELDENKNGGTVKYYDNNKIDRNIVDYRTSEKEAELFSSNISNLVNLPCITSKESDILKLRFFSGKSLAEIGEKYGFTKQAAEQIINRSIVKIRIYIGHNQELREYWDSYQ